VSWGRAVGIGLLLALSIWGFIYKAGPKMPDFEVYWRAASRAAAAQPLYRPDDGHFQFKYLPAFAVLAIPLGFLPLQSAKLLWFALSVALMVLLVRLNAHLPAERRRPVWVLATVLVIVFGKFFAHELVLGQVNMLFAVVATLALLSIKTQRETLAGALVVVAVVIKPYAILFLPWLIARRQLGSIAAACVGLGIALLLPAVVYGMEGNVLLHREWWRTVTETTAPNLAVYDNISLAAMSFRWVGPGALSAQLAYRAGLVLLAVAGLVFLMRRGVRFPEALEGGLLLILMPLLSPQGWDYVFLIATPAIAVLANDYDRLPQPIRALTIGAVAAIGLVIFDLVGRTAFYAFMRWSVVSWCFFVVIAALVVLRARKVA
jgi:Glycosyltransferase family 87